MVKRVLLIFLSIIVSVMVLLNVIPQKDVVKESPFIVKDNERPMIIAHRGGRGLFPENTIEAFDGAVELGVDVLEMDVCLTKDGVLVTHHDENIDRTSDGSGKVIDYTYEELKSFNFGKNFEALDGTRPYENKKASIISIDELMDKYQGDVAFVIEIKDSGENGKKAADKLSSIIRKYNMQDRTIVGSFYDEIFNYMRDNHNDIRISPAREVITDFVIKAYTLRSLFFNEGIIALQIPCEDSGLPLDTSILINTAHRRNIAVQYWTINDKETMRELIEKGADGIVTDRPDLMIELLEEMDI